MRWIIGGIVHETNTWSPLLTRISDFAVDDQTLTGRAALEHHRSGRNPWSAFIHVAEQEGIDLCATLTATADPSGLVQRQDYESLKKQLLDGIRDQLPADGILLWLHGAMVAEGCPDADGDLLAAIRATAGAVPIMAVLDYHGNISQKMVDHSTVLVGYDTYPHLDEYESGEEAARIMLQTNGGHIRPVQALSKPPIIAPGVFARSGYGPMQEMHRRIAQLEQSPQVINGSAFGGFAHADVYEAGLSLLIVTDNDLLLAQRLADELSGFAWQERHQFARQLPDPAQAVQMALHSPSSPVLMADVADNPGGGASGDSTAILQALLQARVRDAAVGSICDAQAVSACAAQGIGQTIDLIIGGKTDQHHGPSLPVSGYIKLLSDGTYWGDGPMRGERLGRMGKTAVLQVDGITVLLTERRVQAVDAQVFRSQGIEPLRQRICVVKSTVHYRAAFEPLMAEIIEVHGPGLASPNLQSAEYRYLRRPMFPLDSL